MPISAYSADRDTNAGIAPGNIRSPDFARDQQQINSIRQLMADLAAVLNVDPVVLTGGLTVGGQLIGGGTTTNDNAAAGKIGEYISSTVLSGAAVALVTGVDKNVTSISLTAGDWDVTGNVGFIANAATSWTFIKQSLSLVTNTSDNTPGRLSTMQFPATVWGGGADRFTFPAMSIRLSLAATTTVFLVGGANFTINTQAAFGTIAGRRAR